MITEADTCRKYVLPKLYSAGWSDDQISEQKTFTDGRIVVAGSKVSRRPRTGSLGSGSRSGAGAVGQLFGEERQTVPSPDSGVPGKGFSLDPQRDFVSRPLCEIAA